MTGQKKIFSKSLGGIGLVIFLSVMLFLRADKDKLSFNKITGKVINIGSSISTLPNLDPAKHRFLQLDNYEKVLQVFIGKDAGDFKPEFENIDKLQLGDTITVYYDENYKTEQDPINRLVYFIDKGDEPIFIKGTWEKGLAYFLFALCIALLTTIIYLKKIGKIT
jgi:hypothetical protein